jgi:hypothetical protein
MEQTTAAMSFDPSQTWHASIAYILPTADANTAP